MWRRQRFPRDENVAAEPELEEVEDEESETGTSSGTGTYETESTGAGTETEASETESTGTETSEENSSEAKKVLKKSWMGNLFEVHLTDSRIIRGFLECTDREANAIFTEAYERWPDDEDYYRWVGMVTIAKKHVEKMFLIDPTEGAPPEMMI